MSERNEKVLNAKNALMAALGDNASKYLEHMKFWFRHKWSKEEFDVKSRELLTPETMHFHNQFLLAILNKIDSLTMPKMTVESGSYISSTNNKGSKKRKKSSRISSERATFEPFDLFEFLPEEDLNLIQIPNAVEDNMKEIPAQRYCVQELFLPDTGFIMGRFLVQAWESGLENVDDCVAELMVTAVQILLKNIISAIILKRKHYRTTGSGQFFYDVGHPLRDPFIRNTVTRVKLTDDPIDTDMQMPFGSRKTTDDTTILSACEELNPIRKKIITVNDVYNVLQDRNIISSHSIHSMNMERLSQMLH